MRKVIINLLILSCMCIISACGNSDDLSQITNESPTVPLSQTGNSQNKSVSSPIPQVANEPAETTNSPIGKFDFTNFAYPLPQGWKDADGEVVLEKGEAEVIISEEERKLGAKHIKTKYGDVTGDGQDEAIVIIKLETGGSALPQVVYFFEWKDDKPQLISHFRTGDRADGGLRDLKVENSELIVELYGQDRYIFGEVETMKIVGDEEDLCCPTYFTRTRYKLNGSRFILQGKRETFSVADPDAPPVENLGEKRLEEERRPKRRK